MIRILLFLLFLNSYSSTLAQDQIFKINASDGLVKSNLDGSAAEVLVYPGLQFTHDIEYDAVNDQIYWIDFGSKKIQRADTDGSNQEVIIQLDNTSFPRGLALDLTNDQLYWTEFQAGQIFTSNLDGSNIQEIISGLTEIDDLIVDPNNSLIYFTNEGRILQTNLNGQNMTTIFEDGNQDISSLAFDSSTNTLYWPDVISQQIFKINTNGQNFEIVLNVGIPIQDLVLTPDLGKMYWSDFSNAAIHSSDLDGNNPLVLVNEGLSKPFGLAIVEDEIYWTDAGSDKIQKANLDGSNPQDIITTHLINPRSVALDLNQQTVYWTDNTLQSIQRMSFDGTDLEILVDENIISPISLSIDPIGEKMYWIDNFTGKIQSANLDGSNVQDLVVDLENPANLFLDLSNQAIYWVDRELKKIFNCDFNGNNIQPIISTGLITPMDLYVDIEAGKIYWTDIFFDEIKKANLDGSNVETVYSNEEEDLYAMAGLQVIHEELFWYEKSTNSKNLKKITLGNSTPSIVQANFNVADFALNSNSISANFDIQQSSISCFPNPVKDHLQILGIEKGWVKMYNQIGQLVFTEELENKLRLSVGHLNKGLYFIRIFSSNKIVFVHSIYKN